MGGNTFIPEAKAKPAKKNIAKEKRDRMIKYGNKVTGHQAVNLAVKRPNNTKIDYNDTKHKRRTETSDYAKLIAFKKKAVVQQ